MAWEAGLAAPPPPPHSFHMPLPCEWVASVCVWETLGEGAAGQGGAATLSSSGKGGRLPPPSFPRLSDGPVPHKGDQPPDIQQRTLMLLSGYSAWRCVRCNVLPERFCPFTGPPFLPPAFLSLPVTTTCSGCPHGTVLCSLKRGGEGGGRACNTKAGALAKGFFPQGL